MQKMGKDRYRYSILETFLWWFITVDTYSPAIEKKQKIIRRSVRQIPLDSAVTFSFKQPDDVYLRRSSSDYFLFADKVARRERASEATCSNSISRNRETVKGMIEKWWKVERSGKGGLTDIRYK